MWLLFTVQSKSLAILFLLWIPKFCIFTKNYVICYRNKNCCDIFTHELVLHIQWKLSKSNVTPIDLTLSTTFAIIYKTVWAISSGMILTIDKYPIRIGTNFGKKQTSTFYLPAHQTLKMEKQYCENWVILLSYYIHAFCINYMFVIYYSENKPQKNYRILCQTLQKNYRISCQTLQKTTEFWRSNYRIPFPQVGNPASVINLFNIHRPQVWCSTPSHPIERITVVPLL